MLNESDLERYASQLIMPEIEEEGQSILLKSKVLIIGAGGLGNPTAIFCSAAGIGNIDICDHDNIELSNLNRQIAFTVNNLGLSKSIKLKDYCLNLNPNLKINSIVDSFDNKFPVDNYDIILDCSDNIKTKYTANILADPIDLEMDAYKKQLAEFKNPFWTSREPIGLTVTSGDKVTRLKYDVYHWAWGAKPKVNPKGEIDNLYIKLFGRRGEPSGLAYWRDRIASGKNLSQIENEMKTFSRNQ